MRKKVVLAASVAIALMSMTLMATATYAFPHVDAFPKVQNTYYFTMFPGGYWSTYSVLDDDVYGSTTGQGWCDKYVMTVEVAAYVEVTVEDCCLMGDTIALGKSASKYWSATSPDTIFLCGSLDPGTYVFYVGYIPPHTGVFPAGYDIYVSSPPW